MKTKTTVSEYGLLIVIVLLMVIGDRVGHGQQLQYNEIVTTPGLTIAGLLPTTATNAMLASNVVSGVALTNANLKNATASGLTTTNTILATTGGSTIFNSSQMFYDLGTGSGLFAIPMGTTNGIDFSHGILVGGGVGTIGFASRTLYGGWSVVGDFNIQGEVTANTTTNLLRISGSDDYVINGLTYWSPQSASYSFIFDDVHAYDVVSTFTYSSVPIPHWEIFDGANGFVSATNSSSDPTASYRLTQDARDHNIFTPPSVSKQALALVSNTNLFYGDMFSKNLNLSGDLTVHGSGYLSGSLAVNGSIYAGGTVSANTFSGDGGGISGIDLHRVLSENSDAGGLDILNVGNFSAASVIFGATTVAAPFVVSGRDGGTGKNTDVDDLFTIHQQTGSSQYYSAVNDVDDGGEVEHTEIEGAGGPFYYISKQFQLGDVLNYGGVYDSLFRADHNYAAGSTVKRRNGGSRYNLYGDGFGRSWTDVGSLYGVGGYNGEQDEYLVEFAQDCDIKDGIFARVIKTDGYNRAKIGFTPIAEHTIFVPATAMLQITKTATSTPQLDLDESGVLNTNNLVAGGATYSSKGYYTVPNTMPGLEYNWVSNTTADIGRNGGNFQDTNTFTKFLTMVRTAPPLVLTGTPNASVGATVTIRPHGFRKSNGYMTLVQGTNATPRVGVVLIGPKLDDASWLTNGAISYRTNFTSGTTNVNTSQRMAEWAIPAIASSPAATLGHAAVLMQLQRADGVWETVDKLSIAFGATSVLDTNSVTLRCKQPSGVAMRVTNDVSGTGYVAALDATQTNTFTLLP